MYAIIRAGGHQEKVTPGEKITVDRMKEEVGDTVTWVPLVVSKADGTLVSDKKALGEQNASVVGKIVDHIKGDKIDVFMYRNKTNYRRHTGHRQPLTLVEISEIRFGDEVATAPEKTEAPAKPAAAAKKPAAAKKSTAKKTAPKSKK